MEDISVASSPGAGPYVPEDNTLSSIDDIPQLELEPATDDEDLTDHGTATDFEGTTQIDFFNNVDLEKGRPSLEDSLNYDGHDVSTFGSKVLDAVGLHPLDQEQTNTSLQGSVQEFFVGHEEAKKAMDYEQGLTLWYTIRHFTPALFWALCMGALTITDGYESTLLTNLQAYQPFLRRFGTLPISRFQGWTDFADSDDADKNGVFDFGLPIYWHLAINLAPAIGALFGLVSAARLVNWLGYRQCGLIALVAAAIFLCIPPISTIDLGLRKSGYLCILAVGEGLLGMPWGLLSGIVTSYVSDVTPLRLRVFATTMINIFWLIGAEFSILAVAGFDSFAMRTEDLNNPQNFTRYPFSLEEKDHWTFRGPMLVQFLWIVRKGDDQAALSCLRYLNCDHHYNSETALDAIKTVNEREKADSKNAGFLECFQKPNWRRTEIAAMAMITQQSVGQQFISFGVKLLQGAGISQAISLWCIFAVFAAYGAANLGSIWVMTRFGRRQGWLWGLSGIVICLVTMGILGFTGGSCWALAGVTVIFGFIFNFTVGPISFTIVAETPSSRLKTATNGAARGCFIVLSMANTILCQYCLAPPPEGFGLGCKSAFIWAGATFVCLVWAGYRLPEMKDRTPAEIDILFEQKVPRRFWPEQKLD